MRILNIIASLDPTHGGPIDGALRLAEIWQRQGHHVAVATMDATDADYLPATLPVFALGPAALDPSAGRPPLWKRFRYAPAMVPWLRGHVREYDVAIVHALWNYSTMAARRVLVGGDTPFFVFPHGALDPWFRSEYPLKHRAKSVLWSLNEGALFNAADGVLFTTEEERRLADGMFQPYRPVSHVVGFGSADAPADEQRQVAAFHAAVPAIGDRDFLLFLSRIHPKKGCDLLVDAFADIADANPGLDLVIAGPDQVGWTEDLRVRADRRGVGARIHWPGMLVGDAKWGAFRACEAFVLPSHSENFGIVVAEALSCGKPVLISDKVNLWREVAADGAGRVEPDTATGTRALLEAHLAASANQKAAMAHSARRCFETRFRFEAAADRMMALFEQAYRGRGPTT